MKFIKVELGMAPPRAYTYGWNTPAPIERGDYVVVPPNSYNPNPAIGRVLRVMETPDFTGTCTALDQKANTHTVQVEVQQGQPYAAPPPDDVL